MSQVNRQLAKRIRKACARSAKGEVRQASVGTGTVSLRKLSARAKGPRVVWNGNRPVYRP